MEDGEKLSIVGENGEGKTTMIKLLLRLFEPDRGEILLGGQPIGSYSRKTLTAIFGPVFQDFNNYSITLRENIGVGFVDQLHDEDRIEYAARKGKVDQFAGDLPHGYDTILGRDFEGGVDVSGGQWQRIAIARAFMGDKPVLLLDEPTSQLDPIAESQLYREFAEIANGKTAVFITHRLASTMITDRILVIQAWRRDTGRHPRAADGVRRPLRRDVRGAEALVPAAIGSGNGAAYGADKTTPLETELQGENEPASATWGACSPTS